MPITYTYDADANIVYTSATGEVNAAELGEYFENLLADEKISDRFWEIVNIEKVNNVTINYKDCVALSAFVKRFIKEKDYQGALLYSPRKLPYLAARLFFAVLRTYFSITFFVSSDKQEFQDLVFKHLKIKYDF